jgi:hypothetical protein
MVYSFKKTQWLRVAGSAIAVVLFSFLAVTVITFGYAFVLAIEVRGRPDQTAISHFASAISRWLMPLLEMFFTFFVAMFVSKKIENNNSLYGLFIGILAGFLCVALNLSFGGHLHSTTIFFFLIVIGLGYSGGYTGQRYFRKK